MTTTAHLGQSLTVFTDTAACDGLHEGHEYAIATDGQSAYIYPLDPRTQISGDLTASRVGVCITAACRVGDCLGHVTFHLDTPGGWTSDADGRRLVTAYGIGVDQ